MEWVGSCELWNHERKGTQEMRACEAWITSKFSMVCKSTAGPDFALAVRGFAAAASFRASKRRLGLVHFRGEV